MQRVDSQTTLNSLVDDLADTTLTDAARSAQMKAHLDAFISGPTPGEALEQSTRLFNRGLALPADWNAMRTRVGHVLVEDARGRVPVMGAAARVAEAADLDGLLRDTLVRWFARLQDALAEPHKTQLMEELEASFDALCINPMMAYVLARDLSPAALQACEDAGIGEATRLLRTLTERMPGIVSGISSRSRAAAGQETATPPDDAADLARARSFLQACQHAGLQEADFDADVRAEVALASERVIAQAASPEALDRLATFYRSVEGESLKANLTAMAPALSQMVIDQVQLRLPWLKRFF